MDKIKNISLGGFSFLIEENAYTALSQYLAQVRQHLLHNPDRDEIIFDVEQRMAELLKDRTANREVVMHHDVLYLIEVLGKPEQYVEEEQQQPNSSANATSQTFSATKPLYRDIDDRKIGGVLSGIAHYFSINPTKLRIAFAILFALFFTSGGRWFFPIHLDVPVDQTNKNAVSGMNSVKQTLETVLGSDNIVIDVQQLSTDDFGNVAFLAPNPAARDYDLNFDGWVGDYQDPSTYLDPFNAETGFYLKIFGLDAKEDQELIKSLGLDTYTQLLKEADAENKDVAKRYEKYAEAQAWMIDNSLVMSAMSNGGTASVTKVTPFTRAYSLVGIKGDGNNYKYMRLQKDPVTKKQFDEAKAKWEEESKKAIEKSQKEFENHVK